MGSGAMQWVGNGLSKESLSGRERVELDKVMGTNINNYLTQLPKVMASTK